MRLAAILIAALAIATMKSDDKVEGGAEPRGREAQRVIARCEREQWSVAVRRKGTPKCKTMRAGGRGPHRAAGSRRVDDTLRFSTENAPLIHRPLTASVSCR
jgi:hypothetical protein